jgi:hypothetical protein
LDTTSGVAGTTVDDKAGGSDVRRLTIELFERPSEGRACGSDARRSAVDLKIYLPEVAEPEADDGPIDVDEGAIDVDHGPVDVVDVDDELVGQTSTQRNIMLLKEAENDYEHLF